MFTFRENTCDFNVFRTVVEMNEYGLPDQFQPTDIIIDIGAHIGCFAYACIQRGAHSLVLYEPDADNFSLLCKNLTAYQELVQQYCCAVWRSDQVATSFLPLSPYPLMTLELHDSESKIVVNTGGSNVLFDTPQSRKVPSLAFDTIVDEITQQGQQRIRIVKVDCEGSEFPILLTSKRLHLIDEICGEFHEVCGDYDDMFCIPEYAAVAGFPRYTIDTLTYHLQQHGFSISAERYQHTNLGIFKAIRTSSAIL